MATTTNYSWSTPDDTALVKDGAAAIRSLGTAIDTTVFTNAGAAVAKATVDAKGDLIAGTADNTVARLAVGTNGQVLTADSTAATGLAYTTLSGGGMTLISTTTLSGATTTLSSIPQTDNNLQIVIRNYKPASDGTGLLIRINSDSGANRHIGRDQWTTANNQSIGASFVFVVDQVDNGVSTYGNVNIVIPDYTNSSNGTLFLMNATANNMTTTNNLNFCNTVGYYEQQAAVTSIDFLNFSGNFTSGSVLLYGVK
jgi:hypothetical protein